MTRLVHLTDLHFGLHRADMLVPLSRAVRAAAPDVVVVSGDLTQRALAGQFAQARSFLAGLGVAHITVPGNHDVPAYNPLQRLFAPFSPYARAASADLTPVLKVGGVLLVGLNTADPLRWRAGVARGPEVDRLCDLASKAPLGVVPIAVCHHPLEEPPGFERGETRGGATALARMAEAGVRITLSGHLHHWAMGLGIDGQTRRAVFQMQTGTALCARARERDHGFAVLDVAGHTLEVTAVIWDGAAKAYLPRPTRQFVYADEGWGAVTPGVNATTAS
jgi:3',5'-cyclic AMP phosphodiesterase CpdA